MLREADTTRSPINRIPKRQATFCDHVMRREKQADLATTGMIEIKRSRGKQCEKMLIRLTKGFKDSKSSTSHRMHIALKATRDRDAWKVMITN